MAQASAIATCTLEKFPEHAIAVDVKSGERKDKKTGKIIKNDHGVLVENLQGCLKALKANPHLVIVMVGKEADIRPILANSRMSQAMTGRCFLYEATKHPFLCCIELAKTGRLGGIVSRYDTRRLVASAAKNLGVPEGLSPMYATIWPTENPKVKRVLLDTGASLRLTSGQYAWAAQAGQMFAELLQNNWPDHYEFSNPPTIGLLTIATEQGKGGETVDAAIELLRQLSIPGLTKTGRLEGNDVMSAAGEFVADVVVCNGIEGNITLKVAKGMIDLLKKLLKDVPTWKKPALCLGLALLVFAVGYKKLKEIDPRTHGGGFLLGVGSDFPVAVTKASAISQPGAVRTAIELCEICRKRGLVERTMKISLSPAKAPTEEAVEADANAV